MIPPPKCIWPDKIRYKTRPKAAHNARFQNTKTSSENKIAPYPCGDHWHNGKINAQKKSEAQKDLVNYFKGE